MKNYNLDDFNIKWNKVIKKINKKYYADAFLEFGKGEIYNLIKTTTSDQIMYINKADYLKSYNDLFFNSKLPPKKEKYKRFFIKSRRNSTKKLQKILINEYKINKSIASKFFIINQSTFMNSIQSESPCVMACIYRPRIQFSSPDICCYESK
jgi:hypothetical protein